MGEGGAVAGFTILFAVIGFLVTITWLHGHVISPAWNDLKRRNPVLAYRIVATLGTLYGLLALVMVGAGVVMAIYYELLGLE